jgi:hypothetical protein
MDPFPADRSRDGGYPAFYNIELGRRSLRAVVTGVSFPAPAYRPVARVGGKQCQESSPICQRICPDNTGCAVPPYLPTNLHEYQSKGVTEFAIRKLLILKDTILVVLG